MITVNYGGGGEIAKILITYYVNDPLLEALSNELFANPNSYHINSSLKRDLANLVLLYEQ